MWQGFLWSSSVWTTVKVQDLGGTVGPPGLCFRPSGADHCRTCCSAGADSVGAGRPVCVALTGLLCSGSGNLFAEGTATIALGRVRQISCCRHVRNTAQFGKGSHQVSSRTHGWDGCPQLRRACWHASSFIFSALFSLRRLRQPLHLSARMPVRPSPRRPWPPPSSLRKRWGSGALWVRK